MIKKTNDLHTQKNSYINIMKQIQSTTQKGKKLKQDKRIDWR